MIQSLDFNYIKTYFSQKYIKLLNSTTDPLMLDFIFDSIYQITIYKVHMKLLFWFVRIQSFSPTPYFFYFEKVFMRITFFHPWMFGLFQLKLDTNCGCVLLFKEMSLSISHAPDKIRLITRSYSKIWFASEASGITSFHPCSDKPIRIHDLRV